MNRMLKILCPLLLVMSFCACESVDVIYDYEQQLAEEGAEIDAYLEANNIQAEIDESGLRYVVLEPGDGSVITERQHLKFSARVRMMNGDLFQTIRNGTTDEFDMIHYLVVTRTVPDHRWQCFHQAAEHISLNGRIIMYVPSVLALRERTEYLPAMFKGQFAEIEIPGNTPLIIEAQMYE